MKLDGSNRFRVVWTETGLLTHLQHIVSGQVPVNKAIANTMPGNFFWLNS